MSRKVLIVDDDSENLYYLESLFKGHGLGVIAAANGREALDRARSDLPDAVVSDILMPVMDGYSLCREWRGDERLKAIPFIFYTATYTEPKDEEFALSLGADRFVLKPQEPDVLMGILEEVWRSPRPAVERTAGDTEFFRQHSEILSKKLEKKIKDLEARTRELQAVEESFRLAFENMSDVIFVIGRDLKFIDISPSIEKVLGYERQEFIGHSVAEMRRFLAPESLHLVLKNTRRVLGGERFTASYEFVAKDGTARYGEVSSSPLTRNGQIVGLISVARDITERTQAEERLRQSEARYRELYDFLPIPVYELDLEGRVVSGNQALFRTFGSSERILANGYAYKNAIASKSRDRAENNLQDLLKGERIEETEHLFRRPDGSTFPGIAVTSIVEKDGRPVGFRGAIVDITERRRAEEKLRQTLESLHRAVVATVQVIAAAVEVRDPYTSGHQLRVAHLATSIALEMGLTRDRIEAIRMAGSIHDIGKLSVPAELLSKPTALTEIEYSLIREHSRKGYEILKDVPSPWPLAEIVYQHHERLDGSGYPRGLKGGDILLEARIIGAADTVEAMASHRPYRPGLGIKAALNEIESRQGDLYDPRVVQACLDLFRVKGYGIPDDPHVLLNQI